MAAAAAAMGQALPATGAVPRRPRKPKQTDSNSFRRSLRSRHRNDGCSAKLPAAALMAGGSLTALTKAETVLGRAGEVRQ